MKCYLCKRAMHKKGRAKMQFPKTFKLGEFSMTIKSCETNQWYNVHQTCKDQYIMTQRIKKAAGY